jgi:hypothetical protein
VFGFARLFRFGPFFRPADHYVANFLSFAIHHRELPPRRGWAGYVNLTSDDLCCAESFVVILAVETGGINQTVSVSYIKKIVGHLQFAPKTPTLTNASSDGPVPTSFRFSSHLLPRTARNESAAALAPCGGPDVLAVYACNDLFPVTE